MSKEQIAELVRQYAEVEEPLDLRIEVLEAGVRPDGDSWYVPVRTLPELPKRYRYYEKLVDIEEHLREREQVDVLLVPA